MAVTTINTKFRPKTIDTMPSTAGFILSSVLGAMARRMQVQIVGKQQPNEWARVPAYIYSAGAFIGGYLILDQFIDGNRQLLQRRLQQLRQQREETSVFQEFDVNEDPRLTADRRSGYLFRLLDKFGQPYK